VFSPLLLICDILYFVFCYTPSLLSLIIALQPLRYMICGARPKFRSSERKKHCKYTVPTKKL